MLLKVKKYFRYSLNGVDAIEAEIGKIVEVPIELFEGLVAEGFGISAATKKKIKWEEKGTKVSEPSEPTKDE